MLEAFFSPQYLWKSFQAPLGKLRNDSQGDTDPWRQRGLPFGQTLPLLISEKLTDRLRRRRNEICGKSQRRPDRLPYPFFYIFSNICRYEDMSGSQMVEDTFGGNQAEIVTFAITVSPWRTSGFYSTLKKRWWKDYKKKPIYNCLFYKDEINHMKSQNSRLQESWLKILQKYCGCNQSFETFKLRWVEERIVRLASITVLLCHIPDPRIFTFGDLMHFAHKESINIIDFIQQRRKREGEGLLALCPSFLWLW